MAMDYITEIEAIRPEGPIMLLGFSLGGFTAFEISRRLKEKGRDIAFCGVIDAVTSLTKSTDSPLRSNWKRLKNLTLKCCFNARLITQNIFNPRSTIIRSKGIALRIYLSDKLIRLGIQKKKEYKIEYINGQAQYLTSHARLLMWQGLKQFLLIPADIRVDLFKAGISTFFIAEKEDYGWRRYAKKGVSVHTIPAEHSLLFAEPNDKLFAHILDERLDQEEKNNP
jgi:thioesterase domain-containing protein